LQLEESPPTEDLAKLYQSDSTWTSPKEPGLDDPRQEQLNTGRRLKVLGDMGVTLDRVFELGPGRAYLAHALVWRGSQVTAFEAHTETNEHLRSLGIETISGLSQMQGEYDTIILWGVIEHLGDPWEVLSILTRRLALGGSVVIMTEDASCYLARIAGARWTWLLPPEHVVLFSRLGLELCLRRLGYELAACRRWPTDIRAIACTLLGRERALRLRRGFRAARTGGIEALRGSATFMKRILDVNIWPLSEHKVYRFVRTSA